MNIHPDHWDDISANLSPNILSSLIKTYMSDKYKKYKYKWLGEEVIVM